MLKKGKGGKRMVAQRDKVERSRVYPFEEACALVTKTASAKFDETVEMALRLGVDPRKAEQNVRGSVGLPHGLGKTVRIAVFAKGDKATEAQEAGADLVGAEDLVEKVKGGFLDFDSVVATPDMMSHVGKVGKILGPRGLMPSPKVGTVTFDIGQTVKSLKSGRAEYRVDKAGILHVPVGKASFGGEKIRDNVTAILQSVVKAKPATSKGVYLRTATLSCTMGPGVKMDLAPFRTV